MTSPEAVCENKKNPNSRQKFLKSPGNHCEGDKVAYICFGKQKGVLYFYKAELHIVHNVLTSQIRYEMFSVQKRTAAQLKVCFAVIRSLNFLLTKTAAGLQIPWRLIGQMKRFEFLILQSAQWHCSLSTVSHLLGAILSGSRF